MSESNESDEHGALIVVPEVPLPGRFTMLISDSPSPSRSTSARSLKVLWWDGSGYNLLCRRLHQALFRLPKPGDPSDRSVVVDQRALHELLRGVPTTRRRA